MMMINVPRNVLPETDCSEEINVRNERRRQWSKSAKGVRDLIRVVQKAVTERMILEQSHSHEHD